MVLKALAFKIESPIYALVCFVAWIVLKVLAFKKCFSVVAFRTEILERGAGKTLLSKRFAPQANAQIKQNT